MLGFLEHYDINIFNQNASLHLTIQSTEPQLLKVNVELINRGTEPLLFLHSGSYGNAGVKNVRLLQLGKRMSTSCVSLVNPRRGGSRYYVLESEDKFPMTFNAPLENSILSLPGCSYALTDHQEYTMYIEIQNIRSNTVSFKVESGDFQVP